MMIFMFFMFGLRESAVGEALEPVDVVAERPSARAHLFRGGVPGARAPLQVCKSRFGGYAWAGARQGAFARFCDLNGVFGRPRCAQRLRRRPPRRAAGDRL